MIDFEPIIFTRVSAAVLNYNSDASVSGNEPTKTPSIFPSIVIEQTNNPTVANDLENEENAVDCTIQATVYMNGSSAKSTSKKYEKIVDKAMRKMDFQRTFGWSTVENLANESIMRRIATYKRVICDKDTI